MRFRDRANNLALRGVLASVVMVIGAVSAGPAFAVDYGSPSPSAAAAPASLQLGAGSSAALGSFLVGPNGMTLYTLSSETSTGSACTGGCLTNWPPVLIAAGGAITGPTGATGTFSTITRADDGSTQVAYNGRPLYYFLHDTAAGQTNGQGIKAFGGIWLVASLSGAASSTQLGSSSNATLGTILTGAGGMTLYTLSSDPNNGSVCTGGCLTAWPPLLTAPGGSTTGPTGGTGTFGAFIRSEGTDQVTHDGRALYYFAHDTAAGQTNGEGITAFGGVWHVALAAVAAATSSPTATVAPTTAATVPPTSTDGGRTGDGPGALPTVLLLLLAAGAATLIGVGRLSRRARGA